MTDIFKAVILGIVEGITEFLPISSTGHLILVNQFISFDQAFTTVFDIVIQLGAILAVVVCFWDQLWPFGRSTVKQSEVFSIWKKTAAGIIPALVFGFMFGKTIEEKLFNPLTVGIMLLLGGIFLLLVEWRKPTHRISALNEVGYGTIFLVGLAQTLAMIPGTSRSAATIIGGMLLGLSRVAAAEFSFFLAVPTMAAASGYALLKSGFTITSSQLLILAVGFFVSFLVAWAVVKAFIGYLQKNDFRYFGYYRIVLGVVVLLYFFTR